MDRPVNAVEPLRKVMGAVDRWQRRTPWAGVPYAVMKKFGDDNANLVVVALALYSHCSFPVVRASAYTLSPRAAGDSRRAGLA